MNEESPVSWGEIREAGLFCGAVGFGNLGKGDGAGRMAEKGGGYAGGLPSGAMGGLGGEGCVWVEGASVSRWMVRAAGSGAGRGAEGSVGFWNLGKGDGEGRMAEKGGVYAGGLFSGVMGG